METNWEKEDLRTLLDAYMRESKLFSADLQGGASWLELQEMRLRIRRLHELINKKYDEIYDSQRVRYKPPHGD
jgi:hypothetical protein